MIYQAVHYVPAIGFTPKSDHRTLEGALKAVAAERKAGGAAYVRYRICKQQRWIVMSEKNTLRSARAYGIRGWLDEQGNEIAFE